MPEPYYTDSAVTLYHGDCLDVLAQLPDASVDAVCTDPPYGLEFMGKAWDSPDGVLRTASRATARPDQPGGIGPTNGRPTFLGGLNPKCIACDRWQRGANPCRCSTPSFTDERGPRLRAFQAWCESWAAECLRVLKPGGHLLSFGGSRTWHRLAVAIEDAGFEIRDSIAWLYGSGFPKSLDVHKALAKRSWSGRVCIMCNGTGKDRIPGRDCRCCNGHGREAYTDEWQGWGTALKPAFEPIVVGRKPLAGTVAANVVKHGTGALNIDGCRIEAHDGQLAAKYASVQNAGPRDNTVYGRDTRDRAGSAPHAAGRWPTNVVLDGEMADELDRQSGSSVSRIGKPRGAAAGDGWGMTATGAEYADEGGASRFFPVFRYEAKAPTAERPTYQPTRLRLRSDLTPEQVDQVTARLREAGVDVA